MIDVVVRAEGLGKKYLIGHRRRRERYETLREMLGRTARDLGRATMDVMRGRQLIAGDDIEEFWALKDLNFEIPRGAVVGIVGRNGAGKSTLLKVLSRITELTEGRVILKGRVASLLEVGTGFHPELTGRENIFLNGAVLGMRRPEVRAKFDQIVDFAEVETFLDTPVKHYSSGMYVRLAFAVAAHLDPDILIVDEVLAVGDVQFQKKCLGKLEEDASKAGRTVLFVSHNMEAVTRLCRTAYLLDRGKIVAHGNAVDVVNEFVHSASAASVAIDHTGPTVSPFRLRSVKLCGKDGAPTTQIRWEDPFYVAIEYDVMGEARDCEVWVSLRDTADQEVTCTSDLDAHPELRGQRPPGTYRVRVPFPAKVFNAGYYSVAVGLQKTASLENYIRVQDITFTIVHSEIAGMEGFCARGGTVKMIIEWSQDRLGI